ncbi:hypothetical protein B4119_2708 [Parageobacillus caldoxylosilyticus]|uniref:Uncharacterized protein n=1 Tax=Saccharococcus caldoxylosilyticus TaxID=81408 RepID=A0A150LC95_9BACL|nr:hypothetical protein B4119_2708 [Parageobacillus caldoxylosilyticus]
MDKESGFFYLGSVVQGQEKPPYNKEKTAYKHNKDGNSYK